MADKLNITRRDFLNGVALSLAAGTTLSPLEIFAASSAASPYYPPSLTGLRGSHIGSFEIAHAMAMAGARFDFPKEQTDSTYDLVVVGGGISGLAAAKFFRDQAGANKKILVLDNHDDFGGHAKRNEFEVDGQSLIGYGGSQSMESPGQYSRQAKDLLASIGVVPERFYKHFDRTYFSSRNLRSGIYFSREAYGKDQTLPNVFSGRSNASNRDDLKRVVAAYPLTEESKESLVRLLSDDIDYLQGQSLQQKIDLTRSISYSQFLRDHVGVTEEIVTIIRDTIKGYWGVGWDALSALEAYRLGGAGTRALGLEAAKNDIDEDDEPYIFHFPDGNAGITRSLVRNLIPDAIPGETMEDLVTARADYSLLDRRSNGTRVRLNSTAVNVQHAPDQSHVDVTYLRGGKPERVRGHHVVLACYNEVIPHICSEVGDEQRQAIESATKTPLAYINIAVRNWRAFDSLGFRSIYIPQADIMHSFGLDFAISMGDYAFTASPDEPAILHGSVAATDPDKGLSNREQNRAGQRRMLELSFADFETSIVRQLEGSLAGGGFDAERDIAAITVNRWPHGYAYEYNDLYDPPEFDPDNGPHIEGRAQIGRISIANSDSHARAYADAAIDAAYRAVTEQLDL